MNDKQGDNAAPQRLDLKYVYMLAALAVIVMCVVLSDISKENFSKRKQELAENPFLIENLVVEGRAVQRTTDRANGNICYKWQDEPITCAAKPVKMIGRQYSEQQGK